MTATAIFDRIAHFASLAASQPPVRLVINSTGEGLVWEHQCGPTLDQIGEFIEIVGLSGIFSAHDMVRHYQTIFDRAQRTQDVCDIWVNEMQLFVSSPELPLDLNPVFLRMETERTLMSVALLNMADGPWFSALGIPAIEHSQMIQVSGIPTQVSGAGGGDFVGKMVASDVLIVSRFLDLALEDRPLHIWQCCVTEKDFHMAIFLEAIRLLRVDRTRALNSVKQFTIGSEFVPSLCKWECSGESRFSSATLTLCAQLIAGLCHRHIGHLGRSQPIKRQSDSALAKRVHLTKGKQGLRLMFWEMGEILEFANVGPKHELEIASGAGMAIDNCIDDWL